MADEDTISLPRFKKMNITDLLTDMSLESFFTFDLRNFLQRKTKIIIFNKSTTFFHGLHSH